MINGLFAKTKIVLAVFFAVALVVSALAPMGAFAAANTVSVSAAVRNVSASGGFAKTVSANNGDRLQFQIIVAASANNSAYNTNLSIGIPSYLSYIPDTATTVAGPLRGFGLNGGQASVSLMNIPGAQSKTVYFDVYAHNNGVQNGTATFQVTADYANTVTDSVTVNAYGTRAVLTASSGYPGVSQSVRAYNETKNADAASVSASREDYITYTLTAVNNSSAAINNYVFTASLSQIMPFAEVIDNGGGSISGSQITFPGMTLPAGATVSKSFKTRVKYFLSENIAYRMSLTHGNTVYVDINKGQVLGAFTAPRTGADTMGLAFAFTLTLGFALYRNREKIKSLLLA